MTDKERETMYRYANMLFYTQDAPSICILEEYGKYLDSLADIAIEQLKDMPELSESERQLTDNGIVDTVELTREFLDSISDTYGEKFEEAIKDGTIDLYYLNDGETTKEDDNGPIFNPRQKDKHEELSVPLESTIMDPCILVHEFLHLQTWNTQDKSLDQIYLTEGISRTYELLFYKFLKDNYILEGERDEIPKAFLKRYLRNAKILKSLTKLAFNFKLESINLNNLRTDKDIAIKDYLKVKSIIQYFLGESFAIYTYQNVQRGIVEPRDLEAMSKSLPNNDNFESLNYTLPKLPSTEEFSESIETLKSELVSKTMK